jgi:hypothetical protein
MGGHRLIHTSRPNQALERTATRREKKLRC